MIIGSIVTIGFSAGASIFSDARNRIFCRADGRDLNKADYPVLYTYLGDRYNDGTQTSLQFRIPDLRGSFLRGADPNATVDLDAASRTIDGPGAVNSDAGTRQNRCLAPHSHEVRDDTGTTGYRSRTTWEPTGSVIGNQIHANTSDPRFPGLVKLDSNQIVVQNRETLSPEPTAAISPNHMIVDYIIRIG